MAVENDDARNIARIFRTLRQQLVLRDLCTHEDNARHEVQFVRSVHFPDLEVVGFEVDLETLPVPLEKLLKQQVLDQVSAALYGRRVHTITSPGVFFVISMKPQMDADALPRKVMLDLEKLPNYEPYTIPIGESSHGPVISSLLETGHILIGGETGSGKSTFLNAMLITLLARHGPEELRVAIIDPKEVEFQAYRGLEQLWGTGEVAVEAAEASKLLASLMDELNRRRAMYTQVGAKNLMQFNKRSKDVKLPLILLIVDEVTDIALEAGLKSPFYKDLIRVVSKGRAFGLTVVLATQNPKAEVLNTLIRGNMSTRVAFRVSTVYHSRTILGEGGAQKLPRTVKGRMLARVHSSWRVLQGYMVDSEDFYECSYRELPILKQLTQTECEMIEYALQELEGKFTIDKVHSQFGDKVSRMTVYELSKAWEARGWLLAGRNKAASKRVTPELEKVFNESVERDVQKQDGARLGRLM